MMIRLRRFSWRRILFLGSAFVLFWIFVFSLTPLTAPLPPYTGQYEVGILDVEVEVQKRVINEAILKETGDKAFELSTLAVTLYYPSARPSNPSKLQPWARPWLPQPISLIGTGYARLAHIYFPPFQWVFTFLLWALGSGTVIPGVVDAPLLSSAEKILTDESGGASGLRRIINAANAENDNTLELREDGMGSLPCVVFTHGMAGMSQSYSHYLGSIASHGAVVAAVEHRDGSGPGTIIHHPDGKERKVWHLNYKDLESDPPMTARDLQIAQLAFREAEMEETIRLFKLLNAGHGSLMKNLKPDSPQKSLPGFKDRLNLSAVTVIGHSYGATGALQALKSAGSDAMPVNGGIALDPGKGSGPLNHDIAVPTLILHSGGWTQKQTEFYGQGWHFEVVKKLAKSLNDTWFMTLSGTAHPSCTDAPLIVPWIMRMVTGTTLDAKVALKEYTDVSVEFLHFLRTGEKKGVLDSKVSSPDGPLGEKSDRGFVKGGAGAEWEVHVVPEN